MRKSILFITLVSFFALNSCQEDGTACGQLVIIPEVMPLTKADDALLEDIKSKVTVYVAGPGVQMSYAYNEIPDYIGIPVNSLNPYTVSAQTVSEAQAENTPDEWGQIRYAGSTEVLVNRIDQPTEAKVHCTVVNAQMSVVFDQTVLSYFSDCYVVLTTIGGRRLVFTPDNAATAVAYLTAGETVNYEFVGRFNITDEDGSVPRSIVLEPAMHYVVNVAMGNTTGNMGQPQINLITDCEDLYATMIVDPSQDGVANTENQDE